MSTISMNAIQAYAKAAQMATSGATTGAGASDNTKALSFSGFLQDSLKGAVETGKEAEKKAAASLSGDTELVDVVTAISAAEATLETVVAVRDKVISAYQEISRMPI